MTRSGLNCDGQDFHYRNREASCFVSLFELCENVYANVQRMLERGFNFTHVCSLFLIYSFELKLYKRCIQRCMQNIRDIVVIFYERNFQNKNYLKNLKKKILLIEWNWNPIHIISWWRVNYDSENEFFQIEKRTFPHVLRHPWLFSIVYLAARRAETKILQVEEKVVKKICHKRSILNYHIHFTSYDLPMRTDKTKNIQLIFNFVTHDPFNFIFLRE